MILEEAAPGPDDSNICKKKVSRAQKKYIDMDVKVGVGTRKV
jgi:hypothetical protein